MRRWIEHDTVESEDGGAETVVVFHFGRVVEDEVEVDLEFIGFGRMLEDDLSDADVLRYHSVCLEHLPENRAARRARGRGRR